jgi:hypothetical protein
MSIRLAVTAAAITGLAFGGLALAATPTKLAGLVGPGFTISLKDVKGQKVKTLTHGKYSFTIQDKSTVHDWTLTGPGVSNKHLTSLPFTGTTKTPIVLTLKAGKYKYFCSLHGFSGSFTVK